MKAVAWTDRLGRIPLAVRDGKEALEKFGSLRFIETTAAAYAPVADLARKAGIDIRKCQYRNE